MVRLGVLVTWGDAVEFLKAAFVLLGLLCALLLFVGMLAAHLMDVDTDDIDT